MMMLMIIVPARKMTGKKIGRKTNIVMSTRSGTVLVIAIGTGVTEIVTGIVTESVTAGMTGDMTGIEMIVTGTGDERIVTDMRGTETTGKSRRNPAILTNLQRILTMTRINRRVSAMRTRYDELSYFTFQVYSLKQTLIKNLMRREEEKEKQKVEKKLAADHDGYAECYPGLAEMDDAVIDSDDEADFSKMDMGNKKGPVGR